MCLSAITFVCIAGDRDDDDDDDDDMNSCGFNQPHWPVLRSQALGMFFGGACGPFETRRGTSWDIHNLGLEDAGFSRFLGLICGGYSP